VCAQEYLQLLQEPISCQFYSYLNSKVFRHVFNESTKKGFVSKPDIA
jgi:hypothetical protein